MPSSDSVARLNFSRQEYAARLHKTQSAMQSANIDTLIVVDPANMHWLTGPCSATKVLF